MTGEELKKAREAHGMTQREFAAAIGMGKFGWQSVSKWENGRAPIPAHYVASARLLFR